MGEKALVRRGGVFLLALAVQHLCQAEERLHVMHRNVETPVGSVDDVAKRGGGSVRRALSDLGSCDRLAIEWMGKETIGFAREPRGLPRLLAQELSLRLEVVDAAHLTLARGARRFFDERLQVFNLVPQAPGVPLACGHDSEEVERVEILRIDHERLEKRRARAAEVGELRENVAAVPGRVHLGRFVTDCRGNLRFSLERLKRLLHLAQIKEGEAGKARGLALARGLGGSAQRSIGGERFRVASREGERMTELTLRVQVVGGSGLKELDGLVELSVTPELLSFREIGACEERNEDEGKHAAHGNMRFPSMRRVLPRLRSDLDIVPSPLEDRPGFILRDPMGHSKDVLLIPPWWARALAALDGETTEENLQLLLTRQNSGVLVALRDIQDFVETLASRGFLETREFEALRRASEAEFRSAPERAAAHAGAAYPDTPAALSETLAGYFEGGPDALASHPVAVAAPHVSPAGGFRSYASAYRRIDPSLADRTFVILGTSHYGEPDKFGMTRKPFVTPLGKVEVDLELADTLASRAPEAVKLEDYCHVVEHSIEFQVVFLQHVLQRPFKILPILCGAFLKSFLEGAAPEADPDVSRFFDGVAEMAATNAGRLFWILGVDLAHVGMRYGDGFAAVANEGALSRIAAEDEARLQRIVEGDTRGFLELVLRNRDPLRWCGFAPLYTFLRAVGPGRGRVLSYEQWNIDPQSVVSFAGLEFFD